MKKMTSIVAPISIILFAVILRLLPHPPNAAPIAAMALFGGVYLNKRYALIVPLVAMFFSDIFLGFHNIMPFVYGSFICTGIIGIWLKNNKTVDNIIFGSIVSSLLFFSITNFGVWITGTMYAKTLQGFISCYFYALPFFRNTLLGDLIYTGLFFGSYELIQSFVFKPLFIKNKQYE